MTAQWGYPNGKPHACPLHLLPATRRKWVAARSVVEDHQDSSVKPWSSRRRWVASICPKLTANALRDWCRFSRTGSSYIEPGAL